MSISVSMASGTVVVNLTGQLIVGNRRELEQLVLDALGDGVRSFRIDLAEAAYIDSAGLGTLVMLAKRVRAHGGELRLANLNDDLTTLFALTKLDTVFRVGEPVSTPVA